MAGAEQEHTQLCIVELTMDRIDTAANLVAQHLWPHNPGEQLLACAGNLERLIAWPSAQCFIAAQGRVDVGFASINWGFSTRTGQPILRIQDLFVVPEYRRRGVATRLIAHLVQLGQQAQAGRLQLETGTSNLAARSLYTAAGFEWLPDKAIFMRFL